MAAVKVMRMAATPCRDRSKDGCICGDCWLAITTRGKRVVKRACYVNGHVRKGARIKG